MANILFLDDDDDFRDATASILEDEGHDVVALGNTLNLKSQLDSVKFDIALIDYSLPEDNGINIIKRFPECRFGKNLPIIMISSHERIRQDVRDAGIKNFMPKPLDYDKLLDKIDKIVFKV